MVIIPRKWEPMMPNKLLDMMYAPRFQDGGGIDFASVDPNVPTQPEFAPFVKQDRPSLVPSAQQLKGAFERRVKPVITEAEQTALTGGILGDILRAYGKYSVPVNQAALTALGRPAAQEFPPQEPPEMTVPTAFERRGDLAQQLFGSTIGDPANLLDPGLMRGIGAGVKAVGAGARALKPFATDVAEMASEMAMKGVPGMEGTALRMGMLPKGKSFPAKAADEMIQPSAAPEPISEDAAARAMSIRPEQLDLPAAEVVTRGQDIPPMTAPPTPDEVAAARSDTRMNAEAVANRLNIIVPESERVIGGVYKAGRPDGGKWSDLTPEQLAEKGPGFPGTDADIERLWNESLGEVSEAARQAVARTGATWEAFRAGDYNIALQLPLRNQLWYELSGEAFVDRLPDSTMRELLILLDLVGATSARARPEENLERAIAILSQRLRNVPVDVDVTIPSTVTQALNRSGSNISSDLANKTGMFSDTMALTGGVPVRYPISVNDVWEGRTFGISDEALSKNQALHEVFGKFSTKLRDFVNEAGEFKYPLQSWNLQALKWVKKRFDDLGIDPLGPASLQGSDYAAEFDKIVRKLERAGIEVPDGKLTRDVLMNPRTADALRPTTPSFRDAPKATVEFGTLLTPSGKRAADIYEAAKISGDELTQNEYRSILTTAMYDSARGKPTPWESLARVASDRALSVTRIYAPNKDDPFAISGTFMGAAGPNIRIPLRDLTPDQIAYFNAVAGLGLKQKAMAAAEIKRLSATQPFPEGYVPTHTVRFDFTGRVPESMLTDFTKALGDGFEISAMRYPDGVTFDINPRFGDAGPEAAKTSDVDAAVILLQQKYNIQNPKVFNSAYRSEYGKNYVEDPGNGVEYKRIIQQTLKGWNNEAASQISDLAGGAIKAKDINAFLAGKIDKLPIDKNKVPGAVSISSITGRAGTIRKQLRQRISDHNATLKAFDDIGRAVDLRMAEAIPRWDKRAAQAAKREKTKQNAPPLEPEMARGGRVHLSNNLDTMMLELMRNSRYA